MPVVYANILGKWVLLNDEYNINGCPCDSFVVDYLDKENSTNYTNNFIQINHGNKQFYIHISQIQWTN